ncbi:MAG: hypothetical protein E6Q98_16065 [Rhodospirillaceae bacterium]|nr:MAG: hypothetical protein E6Q98_16065 [Rhodospirillaceae bacterium]
MAEDADTLKEFLVALGFKVDEQGFKKFAGSIGLGEKLVGGLAAAAFTAAAAVTAFGVKMANSQERLFYFSQLTGDSAKNLNSFTYAASQVGVSVDAASSLIRDFAVKLRTDPGAVSLLQALGIDTSQDPTKVLTDFVDQMAGASDVAKAAYGQALGIPIDELLQLTAQHEKLAKAQQDYANSLKGAGVDLDHLNKTSAELNTKWRELEKNAGILGNLIYSKIAGPMKTAVNDLDIITNNTIDLINGRVKAGQTPSYLGGAPVLDKDGKPTGSPDTETPAYLGGATVKKRRPSRRGGHPHGGGPAGAEPSSDAPYDPSNPLGIRNNNPGNIRESGTNWAGETTPPGAAFETFKTAYDGLSAMTRNLMTYGGRGWDTIQKIINKWAPAGENDVDAYIADIVKRAGFRADQALNLNDPATLEKLQRAMIWHENGKMPYSDDLIRSAIADRLGSRWGASADAPVGPQAQPVEINQNVSINVTGSGSPHETAAAVADTQQRVNGDLVRAFANTPH